MTRYGLRGEQSGDLLSFGGRVLVHNNRAELEWLFVGARVVPVPADIPDDQCFPVSAHPDLAMVRFPLRREDFPR